MVRLLRRRSLLALAAVGVAAIAVAVAALFQPEPDEPDRAANDTTVAGDNATQMAGPKPRINVISTTSAFPFVQRWVAQYNNDEGAAASVQVSYLDDARTAGDMAIVGSAANDSSSYIPVSAQAVAIVYNIPGFPDVPSGMRLDADVLSLIFNGSISRWNDAAIRDLNQDLGLPDERIAVVYDAGNGSSSALLQWYLSSSGIGWPDGSIATSGPAELASVVRMTPYSIGYVDFSYAIQTRMTYAAVANPHGEYVAPSTSSIRHAVNATLQLGNISDQAASLTPPFINASRLGNSSYPLIGLYYASLQDNGGRNATVDFVGWVIDEDEGQRILSEVRYPSIYEDNQRLMTYAEAVMNGTSRANLRQ